MTIDPQTMSFVVIGVFVTGLASVLSLVLKGMELWRNLKGEPQRRSVSIQEEFATKAELRELKTHIEKVDQATQAFRQEMHAELAAVTSKGEERAVKIHERINSIGTSITADLGILKGQMGMLIPRESKQ